MSPAHKKKSIQDPANRKIFFETPSRQKNKFLKPNNIFQPDQCNLKFQFYFGILAGFRFRCHEIGPKLAKFPGINYWCRIDFLT